MTLAQITNKIKEIDFDNILDEIERKENEGGELIDEQFG